MTPPPQRTTLSRMRWSLPIALAPLLALAASSCSSDGPTDAGVPDAASQADVVEAACVPALVASDLRRNAAPPDPGAEGTANPLATELVLYELQVRSANACHPEVGSAEQRAACAAKIAPEVTYNAEGPQCPTATLERLEEIRLGTLDDLLTDTDDYREAISLRYLADRVGVNAVWLMPPFVNNDRWDLPTPCDNLGSPYSVRDYMHIRPSLSEACIEAGLDHETEPRCWGDDAFDRVLEEADARGVRVLVDIAFNHIGHNYVLYDTWGAVPVSYWLDEGSPQDLWDFDATYDERLLDPEVLDDPDDLRRLAQVDRTVAEDLEALREACPDLSGYGLVRAFGPWRIAFDDERRDWDCGALSLEWQLPGFYVSRDQRSPARDVTDMTSGYGWNDVKFLHHHDNAIGQREALRVREYLFRVMNYWVARGVDGFRLDHSTDGISGLSPAFWDYVIGKTTYYAERRGQAAPIILTEEFHDQWGMRNVSDIMTEGYVFGMTGRSGRPGADRVRQVLGDAHRFDGRTHVMTALETHDEVRLTDGTGFTPWTGLGRFALGAGIWSTPMLLSGQEFGEAQRLEFRRSHYLPGRFEGSPTYREDGDALVDAYGDLIRLRTSAEGAPLRSLGRRALGAAPSTDDAFAQLKWTEDGEVWLATHNLWGGSRQVTWLLPPETATGLGVDACAEIRFVDVLDGGVTVPCRSLADWADGVTVWLPDAPSWRWSRLEVCR